MPPDPAAGAVLSFEDARHVVEEHATAVRVPEIVTVELLSAAGRVLAEDVIADRDFPPFARSTRDGYAVRSADLARLPATLRMIAEIKAGEMLDRIPENIAPGETAAIMTGAPVPAGADSVVMVEYTSQRGERVEVQRPTAKGENVVPRAAEARAGDVLLRRGLRLNERTIALVASVGKAQLQVYKRPRIAVLSTGDEVVRIDATPGPTQIRNSNSYSLAVQIQRRGGDPVLLPIAPDEKTELRKLIEEGLKFDMMLLTGGVSMGRYDLVEQVLAELAAEFLFTGAKIQPGRPVVFGKWKHASDTKYFFGLPGNPVSTMVTFELFAGPMLEALAGQTPQKLRFLHARLKKNIRSKTGLTRFLPANLSGEFERCEVELVAWHGSGDVAATGRANCYLIVPPDREHIAAGEWVAVMLR
jgi:molybdopterin molybdotransferase